MQELPFAELANQHTELLPAREALSWANVSNVTAINTSIAINVLSPHASAKSVAAQAINTSQH
jgi:hypothetical protein